MKTRPYLYHLTDRHNVRRIVESKKLESAIGLMKSGKCIAMSRKRREESIRVTVGETQVMIRDQKPLYLGNIALASDWTFEDVLVALNERVFFWPGCSDGPIPSGVRHFDRYRHEDPVLLRIRTEELLLLNNGKDPLFCRYNSGAPRCSGGVGSPRGPDTFVRCDVATFTASQVVEVTFVDSVRLPDRIERADSVRGPWKRP